MTERDLLFLVLLLMGLTTLVVIIVQYARSRGSGGDENDHGAWWNGPWGNDER